MKNKIKKDYRAACLAKSPTLYEQEEKEGWAVYLKTKSGVHRIATGTTVEAAWQSAAVFYNCH